MMTNASRLLRSSRRNKLCYFSKIEEKEQQQQQQQQILDPSTPRSTTTTRSKRRSCSSSCSWTNTTINTSVLIVLLLLACISLPFVQGGLRGGGDGEGGNSDIVVIESNNEISQIQPGGGRQRRRPIGNFTSLSCNIDLVDAPCISWSSFWGSSSDTTFPNEVIIPCGQCIVMDHATRRHMPDSNNNGHKKRAKLVFEQGLNIQGKLILEPDDDHILQIVTPYVFVQGEFYMTSSKPINGVPNIRITISGGGGKDDDGGDGSVSFRPADDNSKACPLPGFNCDVGQKPIVVAGGKLVIQGLPHSDMPTWLPLHDVATTTEGWTLPSYAYTSYKAPSIAQTELEQSLNCPLEGVYVSHDFSSSSSSSSSFQASSSSSSPSSPRDDSSFFTGSLGSHWETTKDSLRVYQRTSSRHGVAIDLKDIRSCLVWKRSYLLTMRLRMSKQVDDLYGAAAPTSLTPCATSGTNCLLLKSETLTEDGKLNYGPEKWTESQSHQSELNGGVVVTIATEIHFDKIELDSGNVYHHLVLHGAPPEIDLELLEFTLRLPPANAFPDPNHVCGNWVPANGNADQVGWHPFPLKSNNVFTHVVVAQEEEEEEEENNPQSRYFQVTGRKFSINRFDLQNDWEAAGIFWTIPPGCVKEGSQYKIHANVRIHPEEGNPKPTIMEISIKAAIRGAANPDIYELMVTCPPSSGNWVSCDGTFTVPNRLVDKKEYTSQFEVVFETIDTYRVDYDITGLSFELIEGPLDRLIVSNVIRDQWTKGAEILITSNTQQWNDHQIATISQVIEPEDVEPGMVEILLVRPIRRPTTSKDNFNYAVEVALLSRNIVLQGDTASDGLYDGVGAHLVVLQTPNVIQTIQGAEFRNFGQAGVRDRYPIYFDYCGDSSGSIISKNSIRKSNQRCVVLHGSNDVLVEGNVAFDTTGHCFVLESGTEVGNSFVNNLGAFTNNAKKLMPQYGVSGKETDDQAATFWSTNPSNLWQGNVAAGSETFGFSLQLGTEARGPRSAEFNKAYENSNEDTWNPSAMALTLFKDNVAHSNTRYGLKAQGLFPIEQAIFLGFRSYLNLQDGLDVTETGNLAMVDLVLDVEWQPASQGRQRRMRTANDNGGVTVSNLSVVAYPQDRTYHTLHNATEHRRHSSKNDGDAAPVGSMGEQLQAGHSVPSSESVFHLQ